MTPRRLERAAVAVIAGRLAFMFGTAAFCAALVLALPETRSATERAVEQLLDVSGRAVALHRVVRPARTDATLDAAERARGIAVREAVEAVGDWRLVELANEYAVSRNVATLVELEVEAVRIARDAAERRRTEASARILWIALPCAIAAALSGWIAVTAAAGVRGERRALDRTLPKGPGGEGLPVRAGRLAARAAGAMRREIDLVGERVELGRILHEQARSEEALRREVRTNRSEIERLHVIQMRDELTGVLNFKYFLLRLGDALEDFVASGSPFCLLALDLDDFKNINDGYGHHVGDAALRAFAALLARSVRDGDVVFRKSGDEFYVLMPGAAPAEAEVLASRLLETVNGHEVVYDGATESHRVRLATSIGVLHCGQVDRHLLTALTRDQSLSETYGFADAALFKAKFAGKGCARIYTTGLTVRGVNPDEHPPDLDPLQREVRARYPLLDEEPRRHFNGHLAACRTLLRG